MGISRPSIDFLNEGGSADGSSPAENFAPDASTADRVIRCPWGQRFDAVVSFLGYSQIGAGGLERLTPQPHPDLPGMMYATKSQIKGWKFTASRAAIDGTTANQFSKAHVTLGYEHVPYAVKEDYGDPGGNGISGPNNEWERFTYVAAVRSEAEYLSLPVGGLKYQGVSGQVKGSPVPYGIGKIISIQAFDLKWVQLPYDLYSLVSATAWQTRIWGDPGTSTKPLIGRINKTQLFNWPPGTALLENVEMEPKKHPTIGLSWDITFKFKLNLNANGKGWNWLYFFSPNPSIANWYFVGKNSSNTTYAPGTVPDGESLYDEVELKDCWKVT